MKYIITLLACIVLVQFIQWLLARKTNKILSSSLSSEEKIQTALNIHGKAAATYVARKVYKTSLKDASEIVSKMNGENHV